MGCIGSSNGYRTTIPRPGISSARQARPPVNVPHKIYPSTCNFTFTTSFPVKRPLTTSLSSNRILPNTTPNHIYGKAIENEFIQIKIPMKEVKKGNEEIDIYAWEKEQKYQFDMLKLMQLPSYVVKCMSFQQKHAWFRGKLELLRVPWQAEKSQELKVDRMNLLMSSASQFQKINFYKELKVVINEEDVEDAGGVLREWMYLAIKDILNEVCLLNLCNNVQTFYKFQTKYENVKDLFLPACAVLGTIIGKAIFEKIPLKMSLNHSILRQVCNQAVQPRDFATLDSEMQRNYQWMMGNSGESKIMQTFCVHLLDQNRQLSEIELIPNGSKQFVTSENKIDFYQKVIDYFCTKSVEPLLTYFRNGLYRIIPMNLLEIFEPYELNMIICGREFIDVVDLHQNVVYEGYEGKESVIEWFWKQMYRLSQKQLTNVLHFTTGTGRVPIQGFKYLESNRGEIRRFTIRRKQYVTGDPYIKSHTCFNRLELPNYDSEAVLLMNMKIISDNQIVQFGIS